MKEMTVSNIRVARDVLRKQPAFKPGFVEIDLSAYGPCRRWIAACLISMTPGTLALDLTEHSHSLCVHSLYLHDSQQTEEELYQLLRKTLGEPRSILLT